MKALIKHQNALVEANRKEYGQAYDSLNFVNYYQGLEMEGMREELLNQLEGKITWDFQQTKTDATRMSPGCRLCGQGQWSCLFINGKCNCNCFYCPAPQTDIGQPVTQTLTFDDPMAYVEYIRKFNFKGVSFSGGEPFLTYDRVKLFLQTLRRELPPDLYIWMYTNGTRVTAEQLKELAEIGLNEIRYDIGATDYNLKPVKQAIGIVPTVTVEIPAVPDELETIKHCVKELAEVGLSYLNLHQLRLTPHNLPKIQAKGYALSHGVRVIVPESELAALEIIRYTKENGIDLPVNYCSFVYKNRFQKSGLRKKLAPLVAFPYQEVTANGYIRDLWVPLTGESEQALGNMPLSVQNDCHVDARALKIHLKPSLVPMFVSHGPKVKYIDIRISETDPHHANKTELAMGNGKKLFVEWADATPEMQLYADELGIFNDILQGNYPDGVNDSDKLFAVRRFEQIDEGLAGIY
ncbi:MAG: radical SAM protein [Breznakibacter sp.]